MTKNNNVFYVDGYHGGIKGHMPFGSWPDIIHVFRNRRNWKISIEVEPVSWDFLKIHDPDSYHILKQELFSRENSSRVEIVSGSYAQPYCWNISGESNIRQLIRGIRLYKAHFPEITIDTYAVQEPCWTSSLPQILRSLGFKRAVLKNPGTAWAGYSRGINEESVFWVGPDGTSIPCVPRYECEGLVNCWETESAQMKDDFIKKCITSGIEHPVGSQFQDLGWQAKPNLGDRVTYVTWTEYFDKIMKKPEKSWHFTQEDILCTLPWGEKHLHEMTRQVRSAENKIITAEKIAAMSFVLENSTYPGQKLQQAWDNLMMAQHHDAWICALARGGRQNWAWLAGAQTWLVEEICDEVINESLYYLKGTEKEEDSSTAYIKIYNTLGFERRETVTMSIPVIDNANSFEIKDSDNNKVPFQYSVLRSSGDKTNAVSVAFEALVPSMGYSTYTINYTKGDFKDTHPASNQLNAVFKDESTLLLNTDIYTIALDLSKGGVITQLYHKSYDKDFCVPNSPYYINEYRGYFASLGKTISSTEYPAKARIIDNGPFRLTVAIEGSIHENRIITTITLEKGKEAIDIKTQAIFKDEQWIGDPCKVDNTNHETERVRSHHDTFKNLHIMFPALSDSYQIYKNAPYDVCKSRHVDTHFTSWDSIKHNIILNWIDIYDEKSNYGLAVFSDHTTSYGHSPDYPVHLTFGWSGDAGFWWGKCPLKGIQEMNYAIVPHAGDWESSYLSNTAAT